MYFTISLKIQIVDYNMDRKLLSKILKVMKNHLMKNKEIGNLKVSSLLALGHQLEAI